MQGQRGFRTCHRKSRAFCTRARKTSSEGRMAELKTVAAAADASVSMFPPLPPLYVERKGVVSQVVSALLNQGKGDCRVVCLFGWFTRILIVLHCPAIV